MIRWLWDPESANPYQVIRVLRMALLVMGLLLLATWLWIGAKQVQYNRDLRGLILERCD